MRNRINNAVALFDKKYGDNTDNTARLSLTDIEEVLQGSTDMIDAVCRGLKAGFIIGYRRAIKEAKATEPETVGTPAEDLGEEAIKNFQLYLDLLAEGTINPKRYDEDFRNVYEPAGILINSPFYMMFQGFIGALDLAQMATDAREAMAALEDPSNN